MYVATPCGIIHKSHLKKACELLAILPYTYDTPSVLDWCIVSDSDDDKVKYSEMISSSEARIKKGRTALKHFVESLVFAEYKRKIKSPKHAFIAYSQNTNPQSRKKVIDKLCGYNNQSRIDSFGLEKAKKTTKTKSTLKKINSLFNQ